MPAVITPLDIPDVKRITPAVHRDSRGFFCETYSQLDLAESGISAQFVQDNHSHSVCKFTVRGLHYQDPPFPQGKLVRVIRGSILDIAVDLRQGSATYGQHVSETLSAENFHQLWVPEGFAHGFCTLEPDTEVLYKVTAAYAPAYDRGLAWNDPDLAIQWPMPPGQEILSEKDQSQPAFAAFSSPFR